MIEQPPFSDLQTSAIAWPSGPKRFVEAACIIQDTYQDTVSTVWLPSKAGLEKRERIDKGNDGLQALRQRTCRAALTVSAAATSPKEILMLGKHFTLLGTPVLAPIPVLGMIGLSLHRWHTIHWSLPGSPAD